MRAATALLLSLSALGLGSCGGSTADLPVVAGGAPIAPGDPAYATTLQIRYLGAGGVLLKRGDDSLLTAPFFSNPSLGDLVLGQIGLAAFERRPEEIRRFLRPEDAQALAQVTAVLVGHAHYDHLMDVPYVKRHFLPQARIYGSDTTKYILAGDPALDPKDVESVEKRAWSVPAAGQPERPPDWWKAGPRLRVLALKSEHAPILFTWLKFAPDLYHEPLQEPPTRPWAWREGQTLAYLIDFLGADGKTVDFRIHYQDAASTPPFGFPPRFAGAPDERPVDVAILCVPGHDQVKNYPQGLLAHIRPRAVVLVHWENFFAPLPDDPRDLRTVPNTDVAAFLAHLKPAVEGVPVTLPAPRAWLRFAP